MPEPERRIRAICAGGAKIRPCSHRREEARPGDDRGGYAAAPAPPTAWRRWAAAAAAAALVAAFRAPTPRERQIRSCRLWGQQHPTAPNSEAEPRRAGCFGFRRLRPGPRGSGQNSRHAAGEGGRTSVWASRSGRPSYGSMKRAGGLLGASYGRPGARFRFTCPRGWERGGKAREEGRGGERRTGRGERRRDRERREEREREGTEEDRGRREGRERERGQRRDKRVQSELPLTAVPCQHSRHEARARPL